MSSDSSSEGATVPASTTRILIVDDHPVVRNGLVILLRHYPEFEVAGEAADAKEALELVQRVPVDVAIVDLSLPGLSGLELIKQIKTVDPSVKVLVLSMHDQLFYAERALRAGATGYLMKQEPVERVVDAVRKILSGDVFLSDAVANRLLHRYVGAAGNSSVPLVDRLSDRELEVFQLIGQGYSTRDAAATLHLSVKTIESYRANIKGKLKLKNATELVQHAVQWIHSEQVE